MPKRIQRKRTKGWRMPEGAVYVGRPTRWGNPFIVSEHGSPALCVHKYRTLHMPYCHHGAASSLENFYVSEAFIEEARRELAGKDLACFCPLDMPCHADVLLEIANPD